MRATAITDRNRYVRAAIGSCVAAGVAFAARLIGFRGGMSQSAVAVLTAILAGLGLAAAVFALTGVRAHGREGIVVPAVIGLIADAWLLISSVSVVMFP